MAGSFSCIDKKRNQKKRPRSLRPRHCCAMTWVPCASRPWRVSHTGLARLRFLLRRQAGAGHPGLPVRQCAELALRSALPDPWPACESFGILPRPRAKQARAHIAAGCDARRRQRGGTSKPTTFSLIDARPAAAPACRFQTPDAIHTPG